MLRNMKLWSGCKKNQPQTVHLYNNYENKKSSRLAKTGKTSNKTTREDENSIKQNNNDVKYQTMTKEQFVGCDVSHQIKYFFELVETIIAKKEVVNDLFFYGGHEETVLDLLHAHRELYIFRQLRLAINGTVRTQNQKRGFDLFVLHLSQLRCSFLCSACSNSQLGLLTDSFQIKKDDMKPSFFIWA